MSTPPAPRLLDLAHRLDALAARLETVERRLGMQIEPPAPAEPQPTHPPMAPTSVVPIVPLRDLAERRSRALKRDTGPTVGVPPSVPVVPPPAPRAESQAPVRRPGLRDAERLVGGRVYLVAGALVVVIGVGLFLKLGYDAGWFRMTAMWKCIWGGVFGMGLLGAGEAARRKVSAFASAGLSAAGIGALYASAYAAHGVWGLVNAPVALAMLTGVTGAGIFVGARARLLLVAVLSVLGGYAVPYVLTDRALQPVVLPMYLLAILAVGLGLSGWRPVPFRPVRTIVWWGTALLGTFWVGWQGLARPELSLPFLALVWVAVHLELMASVRPGTAGQPDADDDSTALARRPAVPWKRARPIAASFLTSAWTVGMGVLVLRADPVLPDWLPPAGGVVGTAMLALVLAGNLRVLRDVPRTDAERLGAGLLMQAGGLLIAAVALALTGWMEVCAWLGLGVAFCAAAAWIRSRGLSVYGLVVLSIAAARLVMHDSWALRFTWPDLEVAGLVLGPWALLMAMGSLAWLVSARLLALHTGETWRTISRVAAGVGLALPMIALVHPNASVLSICCAWTVIGLAEVAFASRRRAWWLGWYGLAGMLLGAAGLVLRGPAFLDAGRAELHLWGLLLGPWSGAMAACGIAWLLAAAAMRRLPHAEGMAARVLGSIGAGMLFLSVLHPDAALMSVCAAWMAMSVALVLIGGGLHREWIAVAAPIPLALSSLALGGYGARPAAHAGAIDVIGLRLGGWSVLMLCSAAAWAIAARLLLRFGERTALLAKAGAAAALTLLLVSFLSPGVALATVAWVWLAVAGATVRLSAVERRLELDRLGLCGLAAGVGAWIGAFPAQGWSATAGAWTIHPGLLQAGAIVGTAALAGWWLWRRDASRPHRLLNELRAVAAGAGTLTFWATSLEVSRVAAQVASDPTARGAALSIWWGLFAVGLIAVGFLRRIHPARYAGLALLGIATGKALLLDLADVPPAWRVASVLGLGLLMLGVAVVYAKISARLTAARVS